MSIPRDLLVNDPHQRRPATTPTEKINAAYTIGSRVGGSGGGSLLAAETIKREVFPVAEAQRDRGRQLRRLHPNSSTRSAAPTCNVDHRYYNQNVGTPETDYTSINLQPGYQKLCYENALDYVRYRHTDSDFVRVARQQDFLRDLREQIDPGDSPRSARHGRQGRRARDHHHLPGLGQRADRTGEADRLLAGQAAAPGEVPELQRQRADQRRRRT